MPQLTKLSPADLRRKEQMDYALEYKLLRRGVEELLRSTDPTALANGLVKLRKLLERVSDGLPPKA